MLLLQYVLFSTLTSACVSALDNKSTLYSSPAAARETRVHTAPRDTARVAVRSGTQWRPFFAGGSMWSSGTPSLMGAML